MKTQLGQLLVRSLCCLVLAIGVNVTAQAAADTAAKNPDLVLKGDAKCTSCHDEGDSPQVLQIGKTRHGVKADDRTPTCTNCHGTSETHLKGAGKGKGETPMPDVTFGAKTKSSAEARAGACLNCHKKGDARMHWDGSQHQRRDVVCTSCHRIHVQDDPVLTKATQPEVCFSCHKTERAQTQRISTHPLAAGKIGCSDCHNPHGSIGPKLLVGNTVNETCWNCHAEKRGPFLFDHPSANDDCMNCHTPHGSTNAPLLKARAPWLCQQCHSGTTPHPGNVYSANMLPGGALANANITATNVNPITGAAVTKNNPAVQMSYRGCPDCHSQVHGSNNPAGAYLLR